VKRGETMKQLNYTKAELHKKIEQLPRMSYRIKIQKWLKEDEYLIFLFKSQYYGYVFRCTDGFLLVRVFDKMVDPASVDYSGINYKQYAFIEKWYDETKEWMKDKEGIRRKIDTIKEVNRLRYLLEEYDTE
jgi:hypothetical protein